MSREDSDSKKGGAESVVSLAYEKNLEISVLKFKALDL